VHSKLDADWITAMPDHLLASGLSASGKDFVAYLADEREVTDATAGEPIAGKVAVLLPPGTYDLSLYSPVTGESSPAIEVHGGVKTELDLPQFRQDIVVRATKQD
jgi:hypothetical protein